MYTKKKFKIIREKKKKKTKKKKRKKNKQTNKKHENGGSGYKSFRNIFAHGIYYGTCIH